MGARGEEEEEEEEEEDDFVLEERQEGIVHHADKTPLFRLLLSYVLLHFDVSYPSLNSAARNSLFNLAFIGV